jgi:hypothetical protein
VNGPGVTGVSPGHSSSLGPTNYTFTFTDTNGWQDIAVANILINSALDAKRACYLAILPASSSVLVIDDAGDAGGPFSSFNLPGSGTASNSQCSVSATGASVSGSGSQLTVILPMTFNVNFAGNQVIFMATRSNTANSGWQAMGTATVP